MRAAGNVGEGLVDGDPLNQRREIAEHLDGGIAQPLILLEMAADENQLRAELARPPPRHPAAHPERLGFVGRGKHDPAADGDRLAAQRRIEQLLDRGVEGVEVRMEDGGGRFHPSRSSAVLVRKRLPEHKENKRRRLSSREVGNTPPAWTGAAAGSRPIE